MGEYNGAMLREEVEKWGRAFCFTYECGHIHFTDNTIDWITNWLEEEYGADVIPTITEMNRAILNYMFYLEEIK